MTTENNDFQEFSLENLLSESPVFVVEETKKDETKEEAKTEIKEEVKPEVKVETKVEETKEEETEVEETEEETAEEDSILPFYKALNEELGIEMSEDVDKEYLDKGIPGLLSYLKDLTANTIEQELEEIKSLGDGIMGNLYEYLKNGGKPETFVKTYLQAPDYSEIPIEGEDNIKNQRMVVKDLLEKEGYDAEDIKDKLESFDASGILEKEAKIAIKKLNKLVEKDKQDLIKEQAVANEERNKKVAEYWDNVEHTIKTSTDIGGLPIPETKKTEFIKYLRERGKDGMTSYERELKTDKFAPMKAAYSQFLKHDYSTIKAKAKTEATKEIKKSLSKFTDTSGKLASKAKEKVEEGNKNDFSNFKLSNILKNR